MSDEFDVKTGLQQGNTLLPVLFNIELEKVIKKIQIQCGGLNLEENGSHCGILAYADDSKVR